MNAPQIAVDERLAHVRFDAFDLQSYETFLRCKKLPESQIEYDWEADIYWLTTPARFAPLLGALPLETPRLTLLLADHLFDFQRWIVEKAVAARRYAIWADTGLGKTPMQLEFARLAMASTSGKVLIVAPLQVIDQTIEAAGLPPAGFYPEPLEIHRLETREQLTAWCIAPGAGLGITNPEKFIPGVIPEMRHLAGFVLDEASLLKASGGTVKWNIIKSTTGIENKLSCTATPAPNDVMEYASQARFLEKFRSDSDVFWSFFTKEGNGNWIKPYAREGFYRFMASWSIYMRDPAHYGFADILASLPDPQYFEHPLPLTAEQEREMRTIQVEGGLGLFNHNRMGVKERSKLSQLAKGFLYQGGGARRIPSLKPRAVAELAREEVIRGNQVLVWTVFDEESAIVAEELERCGSLTGRVGWRAVTIDGKTPERERLAALQAFRRGDIDILISKASLVGYGLNFQHCRSMVFSGFDDSFERMYQAIRRCYRYGQTEAVRIHIPIIPELEGMIFDNLKTKEATFLRDVEIQERLYLEALGQAA